MKSQTLPIGAFETSIRLQLRQGRVRREVQMAHFCRNRCHIPTGKSLTGLVQPSSEKEGEGPVMSPDSQPLMITLVCPVALNQIISPVSKSVARSPALFKVYSFEIGKPSTPVAPPWPR